MSTALADNFTLSALDGIYSRLLEGDVHGAMGELFELLERRRAEGPPEDWRAFSREYCLRHPIRRLLHQSPLSMHAFSRPRGYPCDADLLDYVYSLRQPGGAVSTLGAAIYDYEFQSQPCRSVRARRELIARLVDEVAAEVAGPNILSVACGHLREAQLSRAVAENRVGRYVAMDGDAASLSLVEKERPAECVTPLRGTVSDLLAGKIRVANFDFVYSADAYDYLPQPVATRLMGVMFDMLGPGGRLLVANFAGRVWGAGYMETFMGWRPTYREEGQLADTASAIPADEIASRRCFRDAHGNIVFLELIKTKAAED